MERYNQSKSQCIKALIILSIAICVIMLLITPIIHAENSSHIVIDKASGRILSGDNIDRRMPMASTTKIMTALVAIESGKIDDKVVITHDMVGIEGSSIYLKIGEVLTIRELLYGLMLRSGNDAATAIAIGVAGSVDAFVDMMNDKAQDLELTNTHFMNPHGLHDDAHYTTARELACIASSAMSHEVFRDIVATKSKVIGGDSSSKRYLVNKNKILSLYSYGNGIKTGYTKKAGRCLVSSSNNGNIEVISVVLNEPDMWNYSINAMDKAMSKYTLIDIVNPNCKIDTVSIGKKSYDICTHNGFKYPISDDEMDKISYEIVLDKNIQNIKINQKIGKILVYHDKHLIFEEKIYTM